MTYFVRKPTLPNFSKHTMMMAVSIKSLVWQSVQTSCSATFVEFPSCWSNNWHCPSESLIIWLRLSTTVVFESPVTFVVSKRCNMSEIENELSEMPAFGLLGALGHIDFLRLRNILTYLLTYLMPGLGVVRFTTISL